ncbi:substrate-binding domain-containing protein [Actinobaculum massiliense]|nr:substrate-binding domain-containing protein [Actinobaculum massiliense]
MALGAASAVQAAGLSVPGDVSITGFDDSRLMTLTNPPLTTLRQPVAAMARYAVNSLTALIAGNKTDAGSMTFAAELVVRGSTGSCPIAPFASERS